MTRLLVVDDDPQIVELVGYKLRQQGFEVDTAIDGQDALNKLAGDVPALVLLDVMMPGMSGLEVLERMRADAVTARTPVLMLTAKAQEEDLERGFALGADDYITKPFSPRELVSRVNAALSRTLR